ncbi:MAG: hypothetical protein Q8O35_00780 [Humidesulfovibrio sp.]|uniref:hypothetical protein n=1 Tax=Humidesulfovibrio sp. TaxID=2910988 RepID=UPI002736DC89|nr:hypothetical protein [Humidesulfovibrio sp.]MDP2846705.1 hypothetical protein [Humidesulfovibrio sp.]
MTPSPKTAESESPAEAIIRCEAEMAGFTAERDACVKRCRELLAAEDPAAGVFHAAEIFRLQRDKLRLEVEMEFRRKRINRIRLGYDENAGPDTGGLAF